MKAKRPPGPRDRLFGLSILNDIRRDTLGFLENMQKQYGDVFYLQFYHMHAYNFSDPDMIREILVEKSKSFIRFERSIEEFSLFHGQSVLTTECEIWQRQRRMLLPVFSAKRFDAYAANMVQSVTQALDTLAAGGQEVIDFGHHMNMLAMDMILRTMFSQSSHAEAVLVEQAIRDISRLIFNANFLPFSLPNWLPVPSVRERKQVIASLERIILPRIRERRANPVAHDDLLNMLLNVDDADGDGAGLSDKEVRDQCMTMFLAGHETTATGLTWAGWTLASNPDCAQRASAEVDAVLGGRIPTFADLPKLEYLGQLIKETLRLYPPIPGMFMRRAVTDVQIGPWLLPKGSLANILPYLTQRDSRWFPDPLRFDPERFNESNARKIPRGAYFPFGIGPRVCIGSNFAMMEMTLILAMLLQRYTLEPGPQQTRPALMVEVLMTPVGGMHLRLRKREPGPVATPMESLLASLSAANPAAASTAACPFHHEAGK
jgi:cytochrome P450